MQKTLQLAQTRIEQALFKCRRAIPPDLVEGFPIIEDWYAVVDHDVPHIHGMVFCPMQEPRPILTAAIIAIETMPGLVIRSLDGCYRLGHPAPIDDQVKTVAEDAPKGRIAWPRFQQLVEVFCLKLSDADDGIV